MTHETTTTRTLRPSRTDSSDGNDSPPTVARHRGDDADRFDTHAGDAYCVLGDSPVATAVADRLRAGGATVTIVDETAGRGDLDALDDTVLAGGLDDETTVIATTRSDARNLLLAQTVRARYGVDRVVALVNAPDRVEPFEDAGHDPICVTTALSVTVAESV